MSLLSCLFESPPLDTRSKAVDTTRPGALRLVKIERAGDVLHVFSHIRKTYRVQWVVLEGGNSPPELAWRSSSTLATAGRRPNNLKKTKVKDTGSPKLGSMWVSLDDVEKAK